MQESACKGEYRDASMSHSLKCNMVRLMKTPKACQFSCHSFLTSVLLVVFLSVFYWCFTGVFDHASTSVFACVFVSISAREIFKVQSFKASLCCS